MGEGTGTLARGLAQPAEIFEGDLMAIFLYLHRSFRDGETSGTHWEDKKQQTSQTKRVQDGYKDIVFFSCKNKQPVEHNAWGACKGSIPCEFQRAHRTKPQATWVDPRANIGLSKKLD